MSPYEHAFNRIRAEYLEMPGMRLTPEQVERLSGVKRSVCRLVLDDLVRAKFLAVGRDGMYARHADPSVNGSANGAHGREDADGRVLQALDVSRTPSTENGEAASSGETAQG